MAVAAATVATISDVIDQNAKYLQTQRNVSAKAHRHGGITVAFCRKQGSWQLFRHEINTRNHQICHDSLFCKNLRRKDKQWEHDKDKNYQTPG